MMYIIVEIMGAMLSFLALATKEMRRGRIGKSAPPKIHGFWLIFGQQNVSRS